MIAASLLRRSGELRKQDYSAVQLLSHDLDGSGDRALKDADTMAVYGVVSPLIGLIDKIYADPITTLLGIVPNLLFFISIGVIDEDSSITMFIV